MLINLGQYEKVPPNYTGVVQRPHSKEWYFEGKLHRADGPAYEGADGTKTWWVDGKRHRADGPAYEGADGTKTWWVDGEVHRADGPARERADGRREWWVLYQYITNKTSIILVL